MQKSADAFDEGVFFYEQLEDSFPELFENDVERELFHQRSDPVVGFQQLYTMSITKGIGVDVGQLGSSQGEVPKNLVAYIRRIYDMAKNGDARVVENPDLKSISFFVASVVGERRKPFRGAFRIKSGVWDIIKKFNENLEKN